MRTATITNILYDVDTDDNDVKLPTTLKNVKIPDDITNDEVEDFLMDYISDTTGFCHNGFKYEIEQKN
jgi:hypothetical protein